MQVNMTTPGADQLNGKPEWKWRPLKLFRKVTAPFQRSTARSAGPLPSGTEWDTVSVVDAITCLAEDLSIVYQDPSGQEYTLSDLILANYLGTQTILAWIKAQAK